MADKKISATMATSIALDTLGASESIKSLTQAVNSANSAWKANEAMLKSTGDYLEASKARYEGLGNTIQAQESKIDALKQKQQGLNVETKEGAQAHLKYQDQIDKATTKLASLQAQQERAKQAMETQKSGVVDLSVAMKNQETVLSSLVNKLEAEGNHTEALKAKQTGLQESLSKQNDLLKKEQEILAETAEKSGKASTAYANQAKRVNDLGAKMASTKSKIGSVNEELSKSAPHGLFSGIISQLKDTSKQEDKLKERTAQVHDRIKSIVGGAAIISGLQNVGNAFSGIAKNGYEGAKAANLVASRLQNMGASSKDVDKMSANMKDLKENTNMSGDSVAALETKFYSMTGSADKANKLAKGVGSITDNLKLTGPQADAFAGGLSKIYMSGKVTTQSLGRLSKTAPGLSNALQKASGKSAKSFNALVASGKMTSSQFNDLLSKASADYGKNKDKFNSTSDGAMKHIQQSWKDTQTALMKPLVKVSATGLSALSKALDNKATQTAVANLGKGIAQLSGKLAGLVNYLVAHQKDVSSIVSSVVSIAKTFGSTVWSMFAGAVKGIGVAFGSMASGASRSKDPLKQLSSAFKAIAAHKTAIKTITTLLVTGLFGAKVLGGAVSLGKNIMVVVGALKKYQIITKAATAAQKVFDVVANMNPFGLIVLGISAVVAGFVLLYKHSAKFRKFVNDLIKAAQDCWKNVVKFFKNLWKDTVGIVTNLYKDVTKWFGNLGKGISNTCSNMWKSTKNGFKDGWNTVSNWTKDGAKTVGNKWNDMKSDVSKKTSDLWKGTKGFFKDGWNTVSGWTKSAVGTIGNKWNDMKNATAKTAQDMWKNHKGTFRDGYNVLTAYTGTWSDIIHGKWNKIGGDLKNIAKDLTTFWRNIFKSAYDWLNNITGGRLGDVLNIFKSIFGKIKDVVSGAIDAIHRSFVDIVRGVIKPFNTLLDGIKKGINWILDKVGMDKIKANWSIPLPAYAQGTKDTHQGGLALVNDGQGANYREMYRLPNGQIGMFPKDRNMVLPLPKGTSVLDGEKSASLAKMLGIPGYAGGIGSFFEGIWDKGKDLLEDADKIIAHPIDFLSGIFDKMVGGLSSKIELAQDLITGLPKTIASGAIKWVKSLFSDEGDAGGGSHGNPGGSGVQRWKDDVIRALRANNASTSADMVARILRQINTESGGNPNARQPGADPDGDGSGPALGLMQTKRATFIANAFPGHKDIFNGYDDLLAGIHYAIRTYGPSMSFLGNGHGYANGGLIDQEQIARLGEGNHKEMVIPLELQDNSRAYTLLGETITRLAKNDSTTNQTITNTTANSEIGKLKNQLENMNNKFDKLLSLMSMQIGATKNIGTFDKAGFYRQMAIDQSMSDYQTFN
ncbi:tape measure protein [Liquorilactobacillus satsumensis]|uniref:Phage tail tape mesure n=1 Tax=Liquorilactobacillus satsumensis DSM 16230 = JCM 12392 TaxID=1423801 RepID=A0A0R1V270_9LACO|nr:tape measure protein [Liquorilactobacillus satsumensis]KRL99745.1 phage tail tape mesure [Liquorilactobacillus satsumensis DSM 16230 = JCM 12392]